MKVNLEQRGQSLQRVQTSVKVLEHNLASVFFFDLIRVNFAVFLLDELDKVLQLHIRVHFVRCHCFQLSESLQHTLDWFPGLFALFESFEQIGVFPVHVLKNLSFLGPFLFFGMNELSPFAHFVQIFAFGGLAEHFEFSFRLLVVQVLRVLAQVARDLELTIQNLLVVAVLAHATGGHD